MKILKYIPALAVVLALCSCTNKNLGKSHEALPDSLIVRNYIYELISQYTDSLDYSISIDSLAGQAGVSYTTDTIITSADGRFRIFVLEEESCGAYCNSMWYSWIRYKTKDNKELSSPLTADAVYVVYELPDSNYLLLDRSGNRISGVMSVTCMGAQVLSFAGDSIRVSPVPYDRQQNYYSEDTGFSFCQENGVATDNLPENFPYIDYDAHKRELHYYYGNNYAYRYDRDIDTLRKGHFIYRNGNFVLKEEKVTVINRERN